ncbi:CrfX protein [Pseudomonas sp. N040]|uniref:CrfX protein n=1 Tax=Pseudomonas sp. N040 TaxID=2785325 RepID=UPI0018A270E1|nr:CrfX protein [Pseudomonas sp. N040]MBF7730771.1 CrfX protein [Pseudomonas sp. N040]MBW7014414.1 CrfX protein [Pseudomonas sp. N040]
MQDPFEESLRSLMRTSATEHDDRRTLDRVLRTANRQVGAGDLFSLAGHWFEALMLALNSASEHLAPVSRNSNSSHPSDKAE